MQCPSCGFENMPDLDECVVCSRRLKSAAEPEGVMPPRAKDRTLRQRVELGVQGNRAVSGASQTMDGARGRIGEVVGRARHNQFFRLSCPSFRSIGLLLLCVIPGLGHILVRRDSLTGLRHLLGSVVALVAALILFRTPVADLLMYGVVVASFISVYTAAEAMLPIGNGVFASRLLLRIGTALVLVAVVFGGYTLCRLALYPYVRTVDVVVQPLQSDISAGDSVLILTYAPLTKGSTILGRMPAGTDGIGVILGVPGDVVVTSRDGTVSINGAPVRAPKGNRLAGPEAIALPYGRRVIPSGRYLIIQTVFGGYGHDESTFGIMWDFAYIDKGQIWGKAVAITSPPSHRKLL